MNTLNHSSDHSLAGSWRGPVHNGYGVCVWGGGGLLCTQIKLARWCFFHLQKEMERPHGRLWRPIKRNIVHCFSSIHQIGNDFAGGNDLEDSSLTILPSILPDFINM